MSRSSLLSLITVLLAATLLTGCNGRPEEEESGNPEPVVTPKTVTFIAHDHALSICGIYGAQMQGFFDEEQLTVNEAYLDDLPESGTQDLIDLVLAGKADFGVARADELLTARQAGKPVVAIMAVYQHDPTAIFSLAEKGIEDPGDLVGKTFVLLDHGVNLDFFAQTVGLDLNQVTLIDDVAVNDAIGMFLSGQVDGVISIAIEIGIVVERMGNAVNSMLFYDYGVPMYPNLVFTTEDMIQDDPDSVQRFINGVLRGMQYAMDYPEEMATWIETSFTDEAMVQHPGSIVDRVEALIPLWQLPGSEAGMMSTETWQSIHDLMVAGGMLGNADVTRAYSLRFVNAYYQEEFAQNVP